MVNPLPEKCLKIVKGTVWEYSSKTTVTDNWGLLWSSCGQDQVLHRSGFLLLQGTHNNAVTLILYYIRLIKFVLFLIPTHGHLSYPYCSRWLDASLLTSQVRNLSGALKSFGTSCFGFKWGPASRRWVVPMISRGAHKLAQTRGYIK